MLIDFTLTLRNLSETHLQIVAAPRIEVTIASFMEHPVYITFILLSAVNLFCLVEFAESKV